MEDRTYTQAEVDALLERAGASAVAAIEAVKAEYEAAILRLALITQEAK